MIQRKLLIGHRNPIYSQQVCSILHSMKLVTDHGYIANIVRPQDSINQQKAKMACNARDCEERNKMLKDEKESILVHFSQLKGQMNKFRENQRLALIYIPMQPCESILTQIP